MTEIQKKLYDLLLSEVSSLDTSIDIILDKSFADLGLDSLDVFSFISTVESEFNVKVEDDDLPSLTTLALLEDFILKKSA